MLRAEDRSLVRPARLIVHHHHHHHRVQMNLDKIIVPAERAVLRMQDARFSLHCEHRIDERGLFGRSQSLSQ